MEDSKISKEEMIASLSRSGYFLETRILDTLQQYEYGNTPNETYPDLSTGKSREIDVYSESYRVTENIALNENLHFELQHRLIIECVNNPQPAVFFKRPDKNPRTNYGKFFYSKTEREILNHKYGHLPDGQFHLHTTSNKFHYNRVKANTQYCSFSQKKTKNSEWMASHPDGLHDTFNKLFDFGTHIKNRYDEWIPKSAWRNEVFAIIHYPILVLQNELYEAFERNGEVILIPKDHVVFEFSRYQEGSKSTLIDVVTEKYFQELLTLIKSDMEELLEMYKDYYKDKEITGANK